MTLVNERPAGTVYRVGVTVASALIAVGFGVLVGWGLGGYERRPAIVALGIGLLSGALMLGFGYGPDPIRGGGSLLLGCGAALALMLLRAMMTR